MQKLNFLMDVLLEIIEFQEIQYSGFTWKVNSSSKSTTTKPFPSSHVQQGSSSNSCASLKSKPESISTDRSFGIL